jgi:hypothetical protein
MRENQKSEHSHVGACDRRLLIETAEIMRGGRGDRGRLTVEHTVERLR